MSNNMFSGEAIKKSVDESKDRQKKIKQKIIPKGFNLLTLKEIEYKKSKNDDPMFVLHIAKAKDPKEEFKPSLEYLVIQEGGFERTPGVNLNVYTLVSFFLNAFGYTLKEPTSEDIYEDILKQFKKFKGKDFRGVMRWKKELNQNMTMAFMRSNIWWDRVALINDVTLKAESVSKEQCFIDISPREKLILKGDVNPAEKVDKHGAPVISDSGETDDLPF